jgi:hypothetical protein
MTVICFFLFSDTKKTMFYGLQLKPKLDYTFLIEISVLFSKLESHDVPYLSWEFVTRLTRYLVVSLIEGFMCFCLFLFSSTYKKSIVLSADEARQQIEL